MDADRTAIRIFDLIDRHNIGQAEGALQDALVKFPAHDGLRAAEALVLLRSGKRDLARAKAEDISTHEVTEAKAVNALVHVLQQSCSWEALAATYERVKHLQNERQILENLVQTYVRMGAYDKAQKTATTLNRTYPDPKYSVWIMQACLGQVPAGSTDSIFLKLSTRLLSSSILVDGGVITPSTVRAYVDVLAQQEQYDEAIAFLCTSRGAKIGLLETRLEVLASLLQLQGKSAEANAAAQMLWRMHPDNWAPFSIYMDTLVADESAGVAAAASVAGSIVLECEDPCLRAVVEYPNISHNFQDAVAMAKELQAAEDCGHSHKPQRGPFMAELALLHCMSGPEAAQALDMAVIAYAKRFYRKPCCFLDLSTFMTRESAQAIYEWSQQQSDDDASDSAATLVNHARRILGLRCHVALWGSTADTQPPPAAMRALMHSCVTLYEEAKPLSASLSWSEEGPCDGYINVALNIALHAYVSQGRDLTWLVEGLTLQRLLVRRMSNPSWLIIAVCFASLLGLTDVTALHQLAFKSVQHDTMGHIGYWPMLRGVALDDVATWESLARDYYRVMEKDCSLLRAKVFTFTSWPAMQDVKEFERKQRHSLARWVMAPHWCASRIRDCQTQKNIFELLETAGAELWGSLQALNEDGTLVDNTDWTVAKSVVLGDIHSAKVQLLTEALVDAPALDDRLRRARQLLHSLLLLHDVAMLENHRQRVASAPKLRKAKKGAAAPAALEVAAPRLYCPAIVEKVGADAVDCLPCMAALSPQLLSYVVSGGQSTVVHTDDFASALRKAAGGADGQASSAAFEQLLYPEVYLLAALVRVGTVKQLPVLQWASDLHAVLLTASTCYQDQGWATASVASLPADSFAEGLRTEKVKRITAYLPDLIVDVAASTRRT